MDVTFRAFTARAWFPVAAFLLTLAGFAPASRAEPAHACKAGDPAPVRLDISVSGARSTKGNITIAIYPNDAKHFLDGKYKLARQALPVTLPVTHACFAFAEPGYYAVALFHDHDNSGKFKTTMLGLPAEGYGFSNNPKLVFGPPGIKRVRFKAHPGVNRVVVQMQHYGG